MEREFDAGQIAGQGLGQFVEEMALVFVGQTRRCHGRDRGGPAGQLLRSEGDWTVGGRPTAGWSAGRWAG